MPSLKTRQTLETAARALALATALGPASALAQAPADATAEPLDRIAEVDDNRSPELIDPLQTLALRHLEDGNHELAALALARALEVVRVNYGLYSIEQAPLLRQSIANEEARGNAAAAWSLEQELLLLAERNLDDLRAERVFHEVADDRIDTLGRYIEGEYPPEIVLGCYYRYRRASAYRDLCSSGSKGVAVRNLFLDAWEYYESAIDIIEREQPDAGDALRELEMKLIRANYFYGAEDVPPSRYERGLERFNRLIDYDTQASDVLGQIDSLVQIADWELMYANNEAAIDTYEQAYERLKQENMPQDAIDRLFMPEIPVVLPAFLRNPLVSPQTPESTGFVDVEFEISRYGKAKKVDVLDTTTNASRGIRNDLKQLISRSRFRPMTSDGSFDRGPTVVVRYYVNEVP